jgi:adenylate cyclase
MIHAQQHLSEAAEESPPSETAPSVAAGTPLLIRHYCEDDTIFVGDNYLIKGVAGSILWTLLCDYSEKKADIVHEQRAAARSSHSPAGHRR